MFMYILRKAWDRYPSSVGGKPWESFPILRKRHLNSLGIIPEVFGKNFSHLFIFILVQNSTKTYGEKSSYQRLREWYPNSLGDVLEDFVNWRPLEQFFLLQADDGQRSNAIQLDVRDWSLNSNLHICNRLSMRYAYYLCSLALTLYANKKFGSLSQFLGGATYLNRRILSCFNVYLGGRSWFFLKIWFLNNANASQAQPCH